MRTRRTSPIAVAATLAIALGNSPAAGAAKVDYGPISHKGLKSAGAASKTLKLPLQLGLVANQSGIANAVKAASDPTSASYGTYLSLSKLASKYGASSSKRNAVVNAFKGHGVKATVDVTHLRVSATVTIGSAQKLFGTKWMLYKTGTPNALLALPKDAPKLPKGLAGNVDTVAGLRLNVGAKPPPAAASTRRARVAHAGAPFQGGTPGRTGTVGPSCVGTQFPGALTSGSGLFPGQLLTAYGIAPLHGSGLQGQGTRLAIVGEAPTPANDVTTFRSCFGFTGVPRPGFVPPLLYAMAQGHPQAFLDITQGGNALFGGSCCPARPGYDLATGWGSPLANTVAGLLGARG